jgi:hypothetical protein
MIIEGSKWKTGADIAFKMGLGRPVSELPMQMVYLITQGYFGYAPVNLARQNR